MTIPGILPCLSEAQRWYPLVRYVPPRAELEASPHWENSELPDFEIDSLNACCGICRSDYTVPKQKESGIREEEQERDREPLRKLPCEHVYHVRHICCIILKYYSNMTSAILH